MMDCDLPRPAAPLDSRLRGNDGGVRGDDGGMICYALPPRASPAKFATLFRAPDCGLLGFAKGAWVSAALVPACAGMTWDGDFRVLGWVVRM